MPTLPMERGHVDSRMMRVSRKRQITILLRFYLPEEADRIAGGVQPASRFDDVFDPED